MSITVLLLFLVPSIVYCGFERTEAGGRAKALGGAYAAVLSDIWSVYYNPAGLSRLNVYEVGLFYSPQPFGIPELSHGAAAIAVPFSFGAIGLGGRTFGFELYREFTGTLTYAKTVFDVGVGINLNYQSLTIKNYGSAGTMTFDIGGAAVLFSNFNVGMVVENLTAATIGLQRERLPQVFTVGFSYLPFQYFLIVVDYQKETKFPARLLAGTEYQIFDSTTLRIGFADNPAQYTAGFGVGYKGFSIDYAFQTHRELGLTHEASIQFRWGEKE